MRSTSPFPLQAAGVQIPDADTNMPPTVVSDPKSTAPVNSPHQPRRHANAVPLQLIQQQLLREAACPDQVRQVIGQVIAGQDRSRESSSDAINQVARHIALNRRAARQALPLPELQQLHKVAGDRMHPLQHDARLLLAIALKDADTDLPDFLAAYLKKDFELDGPIPPQSDSRTYNSHLPSIALRAQDYGTAGRTLMLQGAAHLLGNDLQPDRDRHLSSVMWALKKRPQEHPSRQTFIHFMMEDPLDELGVYEL